MSDRKRAIESRLKELHAAVAEDLHEKIVTNVADNGTIANAIKFLKDNGVTVPNMGAANQPTVRRVGDVLNAPFKKTEAEASTG